MAAAESYASGNVPQKNDTRRVLLVKGVNATIAGGSGGTGSGTVTTSAVDPNGVITITGPGWCIGTGAVAGLHWEKVTAGSGSVWNPV